MIRATTRCVLKQTEGWALSACLLCSCCLIAAPSRADYVYGGTQLSWEWLTDASRAIVVGKVVTCDKAGKFTLQVDEVLKQSGLEVALGQTVSGPTLGRSTFYGEAPILRSAGWPALTDPTTYPGAAPKVTHLRPRFARMVSWSVGDRCVVFYASDLRRPIQIINLNKPVNIEVDFLAVDMAGEIVTDSGEVVKRIAARVDAPLIDGRSQVQTAGISYTVWKSPLDGDDYYSVLAPPDKRLAMLWDPGVLTGLSSGPTEIDDDISHAERARKSALVTHSIPYPSGRELGHVAMAPLAAWFWFHSGKTTKDFTATASAELNTAIKERMTVFRRKENQAKYAKAEPTWAGEYARFQVFRSHRTSYRTFPLGWLCVLSYDARYFLTVDDRRLEVHLIDQATDTAERRLHVSDDVHRCRTDVEFSRNGRYLAYTTADSSLCLFDLRDERMVWKKKVLPPRPDSQADWLVRGSLLQFSHSNRYLAQQSQLFFPRLPERPNIWGRDQGQQVVQVWDVATGNVALIPYNRWKVTRLYPIPFDPKNEDIVRLRSPPTEEGFPRTDELWSISSRRKLRAIPEKAAWKDGEN